MSDAKADPPDVCAHLQSVKAYLLANGAAIEWVGTPWSRNCRHWMYFKGVIIDGESLKKRLKLPGFVTVHEHRGTHDGQEQGLVCSKCHAAVMGPHAEIASAGTTVVS